MRTRDLKPGFFRNLELSELPPITRLLFAGLWCFSDRRGRCRDNPKLIKADVFPYENVPVEKHLKALAERGFIERYEVDGQRLIWIPTFHNHQHPHPNEQESMLPPSPNDPDFMSPPGASEGAPRYDSEEHQGDNGDAPRYSSNPASDLLHSFSSFSSFPSEPSFPSNHRPSEPSARAGGGRSDLREKWEERIGILSSRDEADFAKLERQVPNGWFTEAIIETEERAEEAPWPYCAAVLKRCLEMGVSPRGKKQRKAPGGSAREQLLSRYRAEGG